MAKVRPPATGLHVRLPLSPEFVARLQLHFEAYERALELARLLAAHYPELSADVRATVRRLERLAKKRRLRK